MSIDWNKIREEYETTKITLVELAEKYEIKYPTIKSRRQRQGWSKDASKSIKDASLKSKDASNRKTRGAPKGSKNALGNKGGRAPKGNNNAAGNKGGAAPLGNKNAVTTGEYESLMWEFLDEEERRLYLSMSTIPITLVDQKIRELSIRERRMMKRMKKIEDGLTDKQRRVLQELKEVKEAVPVYDEKSGETKIVPRMREALVTTEIEETEFRAIEDILNLEESLTRITKELLKATKQKHEMEEVFEHKRRMDEEKLALEKDRFEFEKAKASGEGNADEDLIEDWVESVTGEEVDGENSE